MKLIYDLVDDILYIRILNLSIKEFSEIEGKSEGYCCVNYDYTNDERLFEIRILDASDFFNKSFLDLIKSQAEKNAFGNYTKDISPVNLKEVSENINIDKEEWSDMKDELDKLKKVIDSLYLSSKK